MFCRGHGTRVPQLLDPLEALDTKTCFDGCQFSHCSIVMFYLFGIGTSGEV